MIDNTKEYIVCAAYKTIKETLKHQLKEIV